jgi:hypothetical protein
MEPKEGDVRREIKEGRLEKGGNPMWFYDEPDEMWQAFRKETEPLEKEYLDLRVLLRDTGGGPSRRAGKRASQGPGEVPERRA